MIDSNRFAWLRRTLGAGAFLLFLIPAVGRAQGAGFQEDSGKLLGQAFARIEAILQKSRVSGVIVISYEGQVSEAQKQSVLQTADNIGAERGIGLSQVQRISTTPSCDTALGSGSCRFRDFDAAVRITRVHIGADSTAVISYSVLGNSVPENSDTLSGAQLRARASTSATWIKSETITFVRRNGTWVIRSISAIIS